MLVWVVESVLGAGGSKKTTTLPSPASMMQWKLSGAGGLLPRLSTVDIRTLALPRSPTMFKAPSADTTLHPMRLRGSNSSTHERNDWFSDSVRVMESPWALVGQGSSLPCSRFVGTDNLTGLFRIDDIGGRSSTHRLGERELRGVAQLIGRGQGDDLSFLHVGPRQGDVEQGIVAGIRGHEEEAKVALAFAVTIRVGRGADKDLDAEALVGLNVKDA